MSKYRITVEVSCDTLEQALQVAEERLGPDEDYGFAYQFDDHKVTEVFVQQAEEYEVFWPENELGDESDSLLTIKLTDEGVIADVFDGGEGVGTWARTAQELTEMIHEENRMRSSLGFIPKEDQS